MLREIEIIELLVRQIAEVEAERDVIEPEPQRHDGPIALLARLKAIVDRALADRIKRLRNGGQIDRYHHQELGVNSRLDEIQAAILHERLSRLGGWTKRRREIAGGLRRGLRADRAGAA